MNKSITPLMEQYNDICNKYSGAVVLMRVGDFYEMYGEKAVSISKVLGIILTKRANDSVPLCGFPYHAADIYIPKIVSAGYKVAVCDQLEDPSKAKGLVKRDVTAFLTPGLIETNDNQNNYLASIFIQNKMIGIAFIDLYTGEFVTTEDQSETYIQKLIASFHPNEIIYCDTQQDDIKNLLQDYKCLMTKQQDWMYKLKYANELIMKQFNSATTKCYNLNDLSTISCGAILQYLHDTNHNHLEHITKISLLDKGKYVWLDRFTITNLELIHPLHNDGKSLLQIIDNTTTPMGSRLIKKWLLLPLKQLKTIEERQKYVSIFFDNQALRKEINNLLKTIVDVERVCSRISCLKIHPKALLALVNSLKSVAQIKSLLVQHNINIMFNDNNLIIQQIENILNPEPNDGNLIKYGVNPELDEYKEIKQSGKKYLNDLLAKEIAETGITSLKISYNRVFGYYLEVTNTHKDKVPSTWIRRQTLANAERYITEDLKIYEEKILNADARITEIENDIYNKLLQDLSCYIPQMLEDAHVLARLDCFIGLASTAREFNYVRPNLNESTVIDIKGGRHPVIERCLNLDDKYVPNDVYLDNKTQQIIILSGPNMVGKSALLRQVALITILAQMGAYVPASKAQIGIVDKVFSRVGASDNITTGESTFMVEMIETAIIMNNLSENSLVIMDEIGRGTSTYDGISIAWAIIEYLHEHNTKTLFATHYHELNQLEEKFERVKNYHLGVKYMNDNVIFTRKIIAGGSEHSLGINTARLAGIPRQIIEKANEIIRILESTKATHDYQMPNYNNKNDNDKKIVTNIKNYLDGIDVNNMTPIDALTKWNEFKVLFSQVYDE